MAIEPYEVIISGHLAGQFVQNVLHWNVNDSGSGNVYQRTQDFANDLLVSGNFMDFWMAALPASYEASSLRCRRVGASGGPTYFAPAGLFPSITGARSPDISSAQVSPLLIWVPSSNPSKTGRTFMPGIAEDDLDLMQYGPSVITALLAVGTNFISTQTTGTISYAGGVYRRATGLVDILTGCYLSPLIGTQRRRLHPV